MEGQEMWWCGVGGESKIFFSEGDALYQRHSTGLKKH